MTVKTNGVMPKLVRDLSSERVSAAELKKVIRDIIDSEDFEQPGDVVEYMELDTVGEILVSGEDFSSENAYISEIKGRERDLIGFHEIDGFGFCGFNACNDGDIWPVLGIMFMEKGDSEPTVYFPMKGNSYNPMYDEPYGLNDDYDEGDEACCDYDSIIEDIRVAFNLGAVASSTSEESTSCVEEITDAIDELVEAVAALTDESIESILKDGMKAIVDKVTTALSSTSTASSSTADLVNAQRKLKATEDALNDAKDKISDLEDEVNKLETEVKTLKTAAATPVSTAADTALDEIAKIIAAAKGGSPIVSSVPTPTAPAAPAKPLKKITLPSKTIAFKYFFGVSLDCGQAVLHIVKQEDWARDELAKEGRVDTDTISRLKAEIPFKRDMFVYNLEGSFGTVEEAIDAVKEAVVKAKVNLEHSADLQAKL